MPPCRRPRLAEELVAAARTDQRQHGVTPAGHQRDEGRLEWIRRYEVGRDVPLEVVDPVEGQVGGQRQTLGRRYADQQCARQPRALRDRHSVDPLQPHVGPGQRIVHHRAHQLEVTPGSDLRYHAAICVVDPLRRDDVREDLSTRADDRRAGVVAAGLQREQGAAHERLTGPAAGTSSRLPRRVAGVRHMISASSPLSW